MIKKSITIPIFWGVIEGILLFGLNLVLQKLWDPFIIFNNVFENVHLIQEIILFGLIFLFFGYLSVQTNASVATNNRNETIAGLTGITVGIVYAILTDYYIAITKLIGFQYYQKYLVTNDLFHLKFYLSFLASGEILPFLILVICFSLTMHVLGAILHQKVTSFLEQIPVKKIRNNLKTRILSNISVVFVCGGIIVMLIFPGLSYAGIVTGEIEHKYDCELCVWFDFVSVERSSVDSVKISLLTEDPSTAWIPLDKRPGFTILVNGNDVSNLTAIQKQGIAITIDPPDGLKYQKGSLVILKGNGISNVTSPVTLKIIESFPKGKSRLIYDAEI